MSTKLATPVFIKIKEIERASHGYNVIVRVVSVEKQNINTYNGKKITLVKAVVGDETGQANALFKLENPEIVTVGAVLAIRNGRKQYIKGHISLEIDIFGRITQEKDDIKVSSEFDLSSKQHERRRNHSGERRKENRQHREGEHKEHRERRQHRDNKVQRDNKQHKGPRQNRQNRQPRDNRQHKQHKQHKQYRQNRYSKIADIEPGSENLYVHVRIVSVTQRVEKRQGKDKIFLDCVVGDQTGVSDASFFNEPLIKKNSVVALKNVYAKVVRQHIQLQRGRYGKIEESTVNIPEVNMTNNISKKAYVEVQ